MTRDPFVPLTDDELAYLDSVLLNRIDEDSVTEGSDEGILCVSELDGFLTAIVSGPVTVVPSRWLPAVWGDFEPTWDSIEEANTFMNLVMRLMNFNAVVLTEEPERFEPLFLEREWKDKKALVVDEWCEGFLRGVELTGELWAAGGTEIQDMMRPILGFCEASNWAAHDLPDSDATVQDQLAIAPSVRAIHAYWLERRETEQHHRRVRRSEPRIGRNDPCPCGSGKKYKKCCLN
jgi:uncharacterized protein